MPVLRKSSCPRSMDRAEQPPARSASRVSHSSHTPDCLVDFFHLSLRRKKMAEVLGSGPNITRKRGCAVAEHRGMNFLENVVHLPVSIITFFWLHQISRGSHSERESDPDLNIYHWDGDRVRRRGTLGDIPCFRMAWPGKGDDFTWSGGTLANRALPIPADSGRLTLEIRMGRLIHPPDLSFQSVEVYANGQKNSGLASG